MYSPHNRAAREAGHDVNTNAALRAQTRTRPVKPNMAEAGYDPYTRPIYAVVDLRYCTIGSCGVVPYDPRLRVNIHTLCREIACQVADQRLPGRERASLVKGYVFMNGNAPPSGEITADPRVAALHIKNGSATDVANEMIWTITDLMETTDPTRLILVVVGNNSKLVPVLRMAEDLGALVIVLAYNAPNSAEFQETFRHFVPLEAVLGPATYLSYRATALDTQSAVVVQLGCDSAAVLAERLRAVTQSVFMMNLTVGRKSVAVAFANLSSAEACDLCTTALPGLPVTPYNDEPLDVAAAIHTRLKVTLQHCRFGYNCRRRSTCRYLHVDLGRVSSLPRKWKTRMCHNPTTHPAEVCNFSHGAPDIMRCRLCHAEGHLSADCTVYAE